MKTRLKFLSIPKKRRKFVQKRYFFFQGNYLKKKVFNLSLFFSKIKKFEIFFFTNYLWLKFPLPLLRGRKHKKSIDILKDVLNKKKKNKRKFKNFFLSGLTMSSFVRRLYGLSKRNLKFYLNCSRSTEKFSSFLELRLDVLLFKVGFFPSVLGARQAIVSGFVFLNMQKVTCPSKVLSIGDCISLNKKAWSLVNYLVLRSFLKWRRFYRYNLFSFYASDSVEVDFSRLRLVLIKRFSLDNLPVYSFRPTWSVRWYIFRNKGRSFFNYNFLYRFLKKN